MHRRGIGVPLMARIALIDGWSGYVDECAAAASRSPTDRWFVWFELGTSPSAASVPTLTRDRKNRRRRHEASLSR